MPRLIKKKKIVIPFLMVLVFFGATAQGCDGGSPTKTATRSEQQVQSSSYNALTARQPAHGMTYSPTRATINAWIDHWGKDPNKLAYVYFQNANGDVTGYYVFKGLPVSMCTALTPTWQFIGTPNDGSDVLDQRVPAPGVDGVYYSGGECSTKYGVDATSGSLIQYSVGLGINELIYEEPIAKSNVPALGPTKISDVTGPKTTH